MKVSLIDTNIFVGGFYDETKSSSKVFIGLEKLDHYIGICDIQHQEISTVFAKRHKKRYKNINDYNSTIYLLNHAQSNYQIFYNSSRVLKLNSNAPFNINALSKEDKAKYLLLEQGGRDSDDRIVKGDPNDTFFLRNCYNYDAHYLISQDIQILESCGARQFVKGCNSPDNGKSGLFGKTKLFSRDPFLCSEIYNRLWISGQCCDIT